MKLSKYFLKTSKTVSEEDKSVLETMGVELP